MEKVTIVRYKAFDGTEFLTEEACKEYEENIKSDIDEFMNTLSKNIDIISGLKPILETFESMCNNVKCKTCPFNSAIGCMIQSVFNKDDNCFSPELLHSVINIITQYNKEKNNNEED